MQASDLLYRPGSAAVVTFSGAHGSGKSTLIAGLKSRLEADDCRVLLVPSCSSEWFRRRMEAKTQPACPTYDDVNRLGLRAAMQAELPRILCDLLLDVVDSLRNNGAPTYILCDRWYTDIMAYSMAELKHQDHLTASINACGHAYNDTIKNLIEAAGYHGMLMTLTHVFIPTSACEHLLAKGEGVDGKPRSTLDHNDWEESYHAYSRRYADPARTHVVQAADRLLRVEEVLGRIRL